MPRTIKIEIDLDLLLVILFGVAIIAGILIYAVNTYYMDDLVKMLGYIPCKAPSLPQSITIYPIPGNETWLGRDVTGLGPSIMNVFTLNGTYYITSEFYLEPGIYVCIAPRVSADMLLFGALNSSFIPENGYGYIKCVNGDGPVWLNVTLGPGAYSFVVAVYGANQTGKVLTVKLLRPAVATLVTNFVYYPQCGYESLSEIPGHIREKSIWFHD
ncbi:hypothetical protein [Vulcanisaeta sp. JCM 14467]|uniref:hypothetical protein n=1 Tax=Vulcanisaeta sp. JCM 14467 TaxID=1295370 RepID=UPI000ACCBBD5|nr:hypothetical protein [Vulcanisaeta sp. JCM 14467]